MIIRLFKNLSSFVFCEGDKKKKKKSGSGSSTSSNSRSSTPTANVDGAANTLAAAVSKLSQDRPGTPCDYNLPYPTPHRCLRVHAPSSLTFCTNTASNSNHRLKSAVDMLICGDLCGRNAKMRPDSCIKTR